MLSLEEKAGTRKVKTHRKRAGEQKNPLERPELTKTDFSTQILQVLTKYGGRPPHFIAKALGVDEGIVIANLRELQNQGKILLRRSNTEWKRRGGIQKWRHTLN
jgi:predicted transcriptional regulator